MKDREAAIEELLTEALQPTRLEIINESHLHVGHAGAKDGRGHFRVRIASPLFSGKTPIQKHRLVYAALDDLMKSDIHALAIEVLG